MKAVIDEARFSLAEDATDLSHGSPSTSVCGTSDTSMGHRELCDRLLRTEFGVGEEFLEHASSLNATAFVGDAIKARLLQHWVRVQFPSGRTRSSSVAVIGLERSSFLRTGVLARSGEGVDDESADPSIASQSFRARSFHTVAGEGRVWPEPAVTDSRSGCVRAARTQRYYSDPPAPRAWMMASRRSRGRDEREGVLATCGGGSSGERLRSSGPAGGSSELGEGSTRSRRRSSGDISTTSREVAPASEGR